MLSITNNGKNLLLFSNPADSVSREKMTLSISENEGESWNRKIDIFNGKAAYSDIADLNDGNIFVLFEGGNNSPYEGIHFKIVSIN